MILAMLDYSLFYEKQDVVSLERKKKKNQEQSQAPQRAPVVVLAALVLALVLALALVHTVVSTQVYSVNIRKDQEKYLIPAKALSL